MSELDRSLTNIDWLISCAKDKQPIKSKSETTHFCGNCLHCSRLRSPSRTPKTPVSQSGSSPGPSSSSSTPNKPAHSYANIIATAIRKSANQRMTLNEIYAAILDTYPYFRNVAAGWKNSVRHNLSLNRIFRRLPRPKGEHGKGAYWQIDETALSEMKRERKSPHRRPKIQTPIKSRLPLPPYPSLTPICPMEGPNALNQSFTAFYRSLLEVQRLDLDRPVSSLRQTMDMLPRGQEDLSDLDMSKFGDLVTSLNPSGESGDLFLNLKDSFSNFLRELSVSGAKTGTEANIFPKHFPSQELYPSDESSSQEFDWNAIL